MLTLRYPNITGKTTDERQNQMERFIRSLIDQLNFFLQNSQKPAETEEKTTNQTVRVQGNGDTKDLWKIMYPVGSIYMSTGSTDPGQLFGGTWEKIQGKFLLASSSSYKLGSTGGEATHKLTENEMPAHYHTPNTYNTAGSEEGYKRYFTTNLQMGSPSVARTEIAKTTGGGRYAMTASTAGDIAECAYTSTVGGGAAHNNMPPYQAVNMWVRKA